MDEMDAAMTVAPPAVAPQPVQPVVAQPGAPEVAQPAVTPAVAPPQLVVSQPVAPGVVQPVVAPAVVPLEPVQPVVTQPVAPEVSQPAVAPGLVAPRVVQPVVAPAVVPLQPAQPVVTQPVAPEVSQPAVAPGLVAPGVVQPVVTPAVAPLQPVQPVVTPAVAPLQPVQPVVTQPVAGEVTQPVAGEVAQPAVMPAVAPQQPVQPVVTQPVAPQVAQPVVNLAVAPPQPVQPVVAQPLAPGVVQPVVTPAVAPLQPVQPVVAQPVAGEVAQPAVTPAVAPQQPVQPEPLRVVLVGQRGEEQTVVVKPATKQGDQADRNPEDAIVRAALVSQQPSMHPVSPGPTEKTEKVGDGELAAMGWNVPKSCRPTGSPQVPQPAGPSLDGSNAEVQGATAPLLRQKSQVFAPQAAAVVQPKPKIQQFGTPVNPAPQPGGKGLPAQQNQKADAEYSRRAAANLIKRLKENPNRVAGMPSLQKMLFEDGQKSELISMLCESGGNLEQVQSVLQLQEERGKLTSSKKKALRFTRKQMQDAYGDDAEKVMKYKEQMGMVEDDENNPDGFVYLISTKENEEEDYTRSG